MSDGVDPVVTKMPVNGIALRPDVSLDPRGVNRQANIQQSKTQEPSEVELSVAAVNLQEVVNSVADTSLSFSVEKDLSRMIVAVRAVGSDEIIRQFPPEEFITVAKFIAAQTPDSMSDEFLKGILFDKYS